MKTLMKRNKKFDGFKLAATLMVIIGIGGFLLLVFLSILEKQEFDRWLTENQKAIQKASQSTTETSSESSDSSIKGANDDTHNEPNNELVKQTANQVKTQESESPTKADLPSNQADTIPVDAEEAYYAQFDEEMNRGVPLELIGIPRFDENATAMYFKPTDADQQRLNELKAEFKDAINKGIMAEKESEGFMPYPVREGETLYIRPDHWERLAELVEEDLAIQERSLVEGSTIAWDLTPKKQKNFPDGTQLIYFRRRNGDLIRSIRKPDGKIREWVIGSTNLTPYKQYNTSGEYWQE